MDEDEIKRTKDDLAHRAARLDQLSKRFEAQYPLVPPQINRMRLEDLDAWKFGLEIDRWELEEKIKGAEGEET